jgi:acetolactate synthase-1/2/3 large subunit
MVDGGHLFVRQMDMLGLHEMFTLHGSHLEPIYQACIDYGFSIYDTRHEQAAAHMADGWARHTGRVAICAVTAGPGISDAVTGVLNAFLDAVPMIVISGRSPAMDDERLPLQSMDQMALLKSVTKWQHSVRQVDRIPEMLAMAYRQATTGRPGPVYLELPIDVLFQRVDEEAVTFFEKPNVAPPQGDSAIVEAAWRALSKAKRPAILVGGGMFSSSGYQELREVAELLGAPVFSNVRGRGCMPDDHPLGGQAFATLARMRRLGEEGRPDVVLALGARMGMFLGGAGDLMVPADATLIQVDIEAEEIGRNKRVDYGIVGDCRAVLRQFLAQKKARQPDRSAWDEAVRQTRERAAHALDDRLAQEDGPIHQHRLMTDIVRTLPPDAIYVADGGETAEWFTAVATVREPGQLLSHGYLGCLGTGMPFALACKAASPERTVVCVLGDGSVGFNVAELHTAVKNKLPVIFVVNNDEGWGMSKHAQEILYGPGRLIATELGKVSYEKVAEGFGLQAELVEKPGEIVPALKRALKAKKAALLNVMTDPNNVHPATKAASGALGKPPEDGAPQKETALPYYGKRDLSRA